MKTASQESKWKNMYKEFRSVYPSLKKDAIGYSPVDQAAILVHIVGGSRMIYDGSTHRARILAAVES